MNKKCVFILENTGDNFVRNNIDCIQNNNFRFEYIVQYAMWRTQK